MKVYTLERKQFLPVSIEEAWRFFSSPRNLARITPPYMKFEIQHISGGDMYPGQIIRYRLYPIPGIPMSWTTEITHVNAPHYFVDEQRFGPYAMWHHQHHFKQVPGGIEMTDEVNYAIGFGIIGRILNGLFVGRQVNRIFDFREDTLQRIFSNQNPLRKTA